MEQEKLKKTKMGRLDKERQNELEPKRIDYAINQISKLGISILFKNDTRIEFEHKNQIIKFYPYSGWFTGKSIKDGRGINNLLKQIKK